MSKEDTQFKPGQSGNPNGRPLKGYSITDTARDMYKAAPERKKKLLDMLFDKAEKGDLTAAALIWAYMDGKPVQTSNIHMNENPEEKVKRTLEMLKKKDVLSSGSGDVLQDQSGKPVSDDQGSK